MLDTVDMLTFIIGVDVGIIVGIIDCIIVDDIVGIMDCIIVGDIVDIDIIDCIIGVIVVEEFIGCCCIVLWDCCIELLESIMEGVDIIAFMAGVVAAMLVMPITCSTRVTSDWYAFVHGETCDGMASRQDT
jgi:hypothetical protein